MGCNLMKAWPPLVKQIWVVSCILLSILAHGMTLGFTSVLLPALEKPNSTIKMTKETGSWLVASLGLFAMVGYMLNAILMNFFGRKKAYIIDLVPGIAGTLLTCLATDVSCLIIGRALIGVSAGATAILAAVIIGEYASPQYRPTFLNLKTAFMYLGSGVAHLLGYFMDWRMVAFFCVIPMSLSVPVVFTWPESPSWLAEKKMFEKSAKEFFWLRGESIDSLKELKELIFSQKQKKIQLSVCERFLEFFQKFTKKNFLKPVIIFAFAAVILEASGRHIFPAYASQIIGEIVGDTSNAMYFTLAVDVIITFSSIFSSYLVKKMNIRTLLFTSGLISFILILLACGYLYLASIELVSKDYSWIPMSLFALYFMFVNFGCAPIPLGMIGEIFPLEHRAVGPALAGYMVGVNIIIALKIMPYMLTHLKIYGTFVVLATCMAVSLVVLYFLMPETKNRTLQEIEDFFKYGKFKEHGDIDVNDDNDDAKEDLMNDENSLPSMKCKDIAHINNINSNTDC